MEVPWFSIIIILIIIILWPVDDSARLRVYIDDVTGCQYLRAGVCSDIVPRLDGKGQHLGCK